MPREPFEAGVARLRDRYRLLYDEALFTRTGFLAGDDERRLGELLAALHNPEVSAIVCARGGYGIMRLLPRLLSSEIAASPKPLVGFSDVTALHAAWLCAGLPSLHAPVVTQLGKLPGAEIELFATLESPEPLAPWTGLRSIGQCGSRSTGVAEGPAVGGNLEVLSRLLGTPYLPPLDGAVLFLEEIGERPYRLDRLLMHLRLAGVFDRIAAIVVGDLVECGDRDVTLDPDATVAAALSDLPFPVVAGAPFGHGTRNRAFVHGGRVRVDAKAGTVEFLDALVA